MKVLAIVMVVVGSLALCAFGTYTVLDLDIRSTEEERNQFRASGALLEGAAESIQAGSEQHMNVVMGAALFRLTSIRYLLILLGLTNLALVFMLSKLRFVAAGLLLFSPVLLAIYVPLSLAMTFPIVLGAIFAFFAVRKMDLPAV